MITVLLSTRCRPEILARSLSGYRRLDDPGVEWKLVIVDNGDEEATRRVVRAFQRWIPIRYVTCPDGGKNRAVNFGLRHAEGETYVFTDDDAVPDRRWLRELVEGMARWPDVTMFGGCIDPLWLGQPISSHFDCDFVRGLLTITGWEPEEGPLPWFRVWGPNMAIRSGAFRNGVRFDEDVGPRPGEVLLGGEVDLTRRLAEEGHESVYLPRAVTRHQVRPEQTRWAWLTRRAWRLGRGTTRLQVLSEGGVPPFTRPSRACAAAAKDLVLGGLVGDRRRISEGWLRLWFAGGQLRQVVAASRERRTEIR